ncbi:MAG: OmpA family protein [Mediterranea sp.]|jgi:outer membrane protein OmpA-like peptidoglycan-associated protein|nr:OmpA family protein [Mediterranea sp.]
MKKGLLLLLTLVMSSTCLLAQQKENRDAKGNILRGPYETNSFWSNWFIGVGGGVNVYEGEHNSKASFGKRLAPTLDVTVGKWLTPEYGVRLQYNGLSSKGITYPGELYAEKEMYDATYAKQKFNYFNFHTDFMWNLSNAFFGFNEKRVWNFTPFLGFGWARSSANDLKDNEMSAAFGVLNTFRLGKRVDLTLEARQLIVNQRFDKEVGDSRGEGMTSLTLGLSVKLGKTRWERVQKIDPEAEALMQKRLQRLAERNNRLSGENERLMGELKDARNQKPETIVKSKYTAVPSAFFFNIGESTLTDKELVNLDFFVKKALELDKDAKFTLVGSADKGTGSEARNKTLSEQRVDYVYNLLVKKYGISEDRLVKMPKGDTDNRFEKPELNRVVILTK